MKAFKAFTKPVEVSQRRVPTKQKVFPLTRMKLFYRKMVFT